MVATAVLGVLLVRRASGAAMVVGSSAVADVRAVPARVTDHDFSRSDRAARTENLNGERGVGIRPHPKCGILHDPTPRWAFVACVVVARRQVAPPRRTVRVEPAQLGLPAARRGGGAVTVCCFDRDYRSRS